MLSILIPIYNDDVTKLVKELSYQCNRQKIAFEIICFDDGSRPKIKEKNEVLRSVFRVNYVEMSENLGRAKIRNWLAKSARFEYLLFLDGDTKLINKSFIKNYLALFPSPHIIVGGRIYKGKAPKAVSKTLHWTYGSQRESLPAAKRQKAGYQHFHSNNFIIPAHIAKQHPFDESIDGYGYEDLVFAYDLEQAGHYIHHVDNPTRHGKIEKTDDFIRKTKHSLKNLAILYQSGRLPQTRLTKAYELLKKYKIYNFTKKKLSQREDKYLADMKSASPNMRRFNLWKLLQFMRIMDGEKDN